MQIDASDAARFWSFVEVADGCWLWRPAGGGNEYGRFRLGGKVRLAHRVSYEIENGAIPDGLEVCHSCDRKSCVRPTHLSASTHLQNMLDAAARGLLPPSRGRPKIDEAAAAQIFMSTEPLAVVARRFDISISNVSNIRLGRVWQSVTAALVRPDSSKHQRTSA